MSKDESQKIKDWLARYENMTDGEKATLSNNLSKASEAMMRGEFITPDKLYIDLEFFRDTRLGTIMSFVMEAPDKEAAYQHFRKGLKSYQVRLYDTVTDHFPELGITEEQYTARRADPAFGETVFRLSPSTQYFSTFLENLKYNINHSQASEKWTRKYTDPTKQTYQRNYDPVHLFINTWPVVLKNEQIHEIGAAISHIFRLDVTCMCVDPAAMPADVWSKLEDITTVHLQRFMSNDAIHTWIGQQTYTGRYFFAPMILPAEVAGTLDDSEFDKQLSRLTDSMRLFYNFQWLHSARFCVDLTLFAPEDPEGEAEFDPTAPLPPLYGN